MRTRILLVDDDISVRESLAAALAYENYLPLTAANGEEALKVASTSPVDLVILDLNLPDRDGWDTFEQLTGRHPEIPIIVLTGRANQLFSALAAGVGALIEKPVDPEFLLKTMKQLLSESTETRLARMTGHAAEFHYFPAHKRPLHRLRAPAR